MGHKAKGPKGGKANSASRVERKTHERHRAKKRTCIVLPPGDERHPNHEMRRRAAREAARLAALELATRPGPEVTSAGE